MNGVVPSATPGVTEDSPAPLEALRMLDAMRQENRDLAGQIGYLQARVQIHEESIRALMAPKAPLVAPQPALDASGSTEGSKLFVLSRLPGHSWAVYGVAIVSVIALVAVLVGR